MCDEREFICGADVTEADITAYDRGELTEWRRGPDGVMWYRRAAAGADYPEIMAVPPQAATSAGYSDGFGEPTGLTDAERDALLQWADELRRGAADAVADDDPEGKHGCE